MHLVNAALWLEHVLEHGLANHHVEAVALKGQVGGVTDDLRTPGERHIGFEKSSAFDFTDVEIRPRAVTRSNDQHATLCRRARAELVGETPVVPASSHVQAGRRQ